MKHPSDKACSIWFETEWVEYNKNIHDIFVLLRYILAVSFTMYRRQHFVISLSGKPNYVKLTHHNVITNCTGKYFL